MDLVLTDGSVVECLDGSFENELLIKGTIDKISRAISLITNENLKRAVLATTIIISNRVVDNIIATPPDENDEVMLVYKLRDKNDIEILNERIKEQDEALMELAELIGG